MQTEIDLVEIGIGNIASVERCLKRVGVEPQRVSPSNPPNGRRPIVLPGVGSFGAVMLALQQNNFDIVLRDLINAGTPFLGICVGMQILFDCSEETTAINGLGLIKGKVVRFNQGKIPQIGWNLIEPKSGHRGQPGYVYFANSFYAKPEAAEVVSFTADYFTKFCAAVEFHNIAGVQFHPEKSGEFGAEFVKEWFRNVR